MEDYFHIHAFSNVITQSNWDYLESRVETNTHQILDILDKANSPDIKPRATFFVLGWIAERHPALVREIHSRGHEVACHGYKHQCVFKQTRKEFRENVRKAKGILEDLIGVKVIGYRASTFSITKETMWALSILYELGFRYDSSIFPINHHVYGFPGAPRLPFSIDFSHGDIISQMKKPKYLHEAKKTNQRDGGISGNYELMPTSHNQNQQRAPDSLFFEFPLSTISPLGFNLPCSGGAYFRILPYWYTRWGLRKINKNNPGPAVFYIHPWELDPTLPKINNVSLLSRFRTYTNLKSTVSRFNRLLNDFSFAPLASMI